LTRFAAPEHDAIVQAERTVVPELDLDWNDAES
jgi:hypothetical protein